jgi:hypothetical protein
VGAQRSSASKRQRDIDKRSRAAEKRDKRQRRTELAGEDTSADAPDAAAGQGDNDSSAILEQIERLQHEFDADVIDFETYETRKAELLSRIQV